MNKKRRIVADSPCLVAPRSNTAQLLLQQQLGLSCSIATRRKLLEASVQSFSLQVMQVHTQSRSSCIQPLKKHHES
jgi:hypothetical protein